MLCAALALTACGQKRPLQLPQHAKHPPAAAAAPAQPAASAASAPN
ncbi:lipoprotein [Mitsuaria sp. TWR114]|nr:MULTISPECIES: lipoprotein [unclassified Roseateles]TXE00272.1 lipoprotein [Mitsuaria sp. TWR114]